MKTNLKKIIVAVIFGCLSSNVLSALTSDEINIFTRACDQFVFSFYTLELPEYKILATADIVNQELFTAQEISIIKATLEQLKNGMTMTGNPTQDTFTLLQDACGNLRDNLDTIKANIGTALARIPMPKCLEIAQHAVCAAETQLKEAYQAANSIRGYGGSALSKNLPCMLHLFLESALNFYRQAKKNLKRAQRERTIERVVFTIALSAKSSRIFELAIGNITNLKSLFGQFEISQPISS